MRSSTDLPAGHGSSLTRRQWLRRAAACGIGGLGGAMAGTGASPWFSPLATALAQDPTRKRQCILLWMSGGPSQTDTFDMKPGHVNGGEFQEVATCVPGLRMSEHLPKLARLADHLAMVRSLSTREGDHGRGTYLMRTGKMPGGPIQYPAIGASLSKELGDASAELPDYVAIGSGAAFNPQAYTPGFLGPKYAAATVGRVTTGSSEGEVTEGDRDSEQSSDVEFAQLGVDFLSRSAGVTDQQSTGRLDLWEALQARFLDERPASNAVAQDTVYRRAIRLMHSQAAEAFELSSEPVTVRQAYGPSLFGQGCLMARRLIERGVPFVEVTLGGEGDTNWDTHQNNFATVRNLSQQLDAGWGTLMEDLKQRGLLETTTILWMGEFGRTPMINNNTGRDHFPAAWTCVFAGGGVQGGQAYGKTSEDGREVVENKVGVEQVLATLCQALGVDPAIQNITNLGRPIAIVEGKPIDALLA